jgi:hypothetical protein
MYQKRLPQWEPLWWSRPEDNSRSEMRGLFWSERFCFWGRYWPVTIVAQSVGTALSVRETVPFGSREGCFGQKNQAYYTVGMKILQVSNKAVLVCDCHYYLIEPHKWSLNGAGYAQSSRGFMHRIIAGAGHDDHTDHQNGDKLDNRCANLKLCTPSYNMARRPKATGNYTSAHKGVYRAGGRWRVEFRREKQRYYIGVFGTEAEALIAYHAALRKVAPY